jgi:hypothetical protein
MSLSRRVQLAVLCLTVLASSVVALADPRFTATAALLPTGVEPTASGQAKVQWSLSGYGPWDIVYTMCLTVSCAGLDFTPPQQWYHLQCHRLVAFSPVRKARRSRAWRTAVGRAPRGGAPQAVGQPSRTASSGHPVRSCVPAT